MKAEKKTRAYRSRMAKADKSAVQKANIEARWNGHRAVGYGTMRFRNDVREDFLALVAHFRKAAGQENVHQGASEESGAVTCSWVLADLIHIARAYIEGGAREAGKDARMLLGWFDKMGKARRD